MSATTAESPRVAGLPDRLLRKADVAKLFGVSVDTVTFWLRTGKLPSPVRVGRTVAWRPEAIARLLEGAQ